MPQKCTANMDITGQKLPQTQIPHYHPLNQWLLEATNGNQGQKMMHI